MDPDPHQHVMDPQHWLDLQSLFGLRVHCAQLYLLAETSQLPSPNPAAFGRIYEGAIGQPR